MIAATTFKLDAGTLGNNQAAQDPNAIIKTKAKAASEKFEAMFLSAERDAPASAAPTSCSASTWRLATVLSVPGTWARSNSACASLTSFCIREPIAPFDKPFLERPDVRNIGGNCLKLGPERAWQIEHGTEQIELGQNFAVGDDLRDSGNGCDHALERRLRPDDHPGAKIGNKRRVAHELDGIAKPLLVDQQDRLAFNVSFAAPHGPGIFPSLEFLFLPAIFVLLPALAKFAQAEPGERGVEIGIDLFGVELERFTIAKR